MIGMGTTIFLVNPVNFGGASWSNDYSTLADGVDEYVNLGRISEVENVSAFTFSMWYKTPSLATAEVPLGINATNNRCYCTMHTDGSVQFVISNTSGYPLVRTSAGDIVTNTWYHIAFVYDGTEAVSSNRIRIYINGVNKSATASGGNIPTSTASSTADFILFNRSDFANYANVYMDEVAFFDYALTSTEVTDIYNSSVPFDLMTLASAKQPEHYYRMGDNDSFSTITDNGATGGNDGTMLNMESGDFVLDTP